MNKYQEALETIQKSKLIFHVYKGQTEGMKAPRIFDLYHGEIFTLRELVEKATPKKPIHKKTWGYDDIPYTALCPNCEENIGYEAMNYYKYCPVCGQSLLWSESEE